MSSFIRLTTERADTAPLPQSVELIPVIHAPFLHTSVNG